MFEYYHDKLNEIWGAKTISLKIWGAMAALAPLVPPPMLCLRSSSLRLASLSSPLCSAVSQSASRSLRLVSLLSLCSAAFSERRSCAILQLCILCRLTESVVNCEQSGVHWKAYTISCMCRQGERS